MAEAVRGLAGGKVAPLKGVRVLDMTRVLAGVSLS